MKLVETLDQFRPHHPFLESSAPSTVLVMMEQKNVDLFGMGTNLTELSDVGVVNLRGVLGQISALHAVQIGPLPRQVPSERGDLRLKVPELEKRVPQKLACLILRGDRRWVRNGEKGLTIQPLPCEYASFCASAHLFKNASDALN